MMAGENVESNAFLQMYDTLSRGIREALPSIAEVAFARKIIHEITYSEAINLSGGIPIEVRTQNFLKALRDRIQADPSAFHVFVSVLNNQYSMEYLGTKLKESLQEQKEGLKKRRQAAAAEKQLLQAQPPPREAEMVFNRHQIAQTPVSTLVQRPTQLVAPGDQLHNYIGMRQATQLPATSPANSIDILNYRHDIHRNSTTTRAVDGHGPQSEPVVKYNTSPGMAFRKNIVLGASKENTSSMSNELTAVTRRAITPGDTSRRVSLNGLMDKHTPKMFGKNYRCGVQWQCVCECVCECVCVCVCVCTCVCHFITND